MTEVRFRQIRQNDQDRDRLATLLAKKKLTELEKGELKALGLNGSQRQDDLVTAKLARKQKDRPAKVADLPKFPKVLFDDDGNL